MAKDKQTDASDAASAPAPASSNTADAPAPLLSIWQWCQSTGKHPHRTQAFVRSQPANEHGDNKPAEQWQAAYDAFNNTPIQ